MEEASEEAPEEEDLVEEDPAEVLAAEDREVVDITDHRIIRHTDHHITTHHIIIDHHITIITEQYIMVEEEAVEAVVQLLL